MKNFEKLLSGGDLRSIGQSNKIVSLVKNQQDFDELFQCLYSDKRVILSRTADAIEKITIEHPEYLDKHKSEILGFYERETNIELKWHLALIVPRLNLIKNEAISIWKILTAWASDKEGSKIVRVNAIQGLFEMLKQFSEFKEQFHKLISDVKSEDVSSINARIKKLPSGKY